MGKEISNLYKSIEEKYGKIGVYRLIVKTKISVEKAAKIEDSDENLTLVKEAIESLGFEATTAERSKSRRKRIRDFILRRLRK